MLRDEAWRRYLRCIGRARTSVARSRQATQNRNTEVEGPGTGPSKHGGGSVSFATTQERLGERRGDTELLVLARRRRRMWCRGEFDVVAEQLRKVMNFMHQHLGMDMDEIGLAQQQPPPPPPPPPPHDQQQPPQIDPADPPQQGDNVGRETTPGLGGRRGGYSGGGELGGGYGGFGAGGLGAYRETDNFRLYSVSNQKRNPYSVSDRISDDVFRDGTSPSLFRF
ncbi:hypothetical protein Sjap_021992 [Stephania japonica]|uniref:Uncharacterized protein n=1 Tax=Stephania japonica TaxID=461633 RepID=A0AAP0HUM1_9MAGN